MPRPQRVLVFCAHSDDQAIGAGGYIAELSRDGAKVRTIICSFGEQSHPHLQEKEIKPARVLESKHADKILGGESVMFLGLHEGKFEEDIKQRGMHEKLVRQVREFKPERILTHSSDDPHPDHRAVHRILLKVHEEAARASEVYTFNVWNVLNIKKRSNPILLVDITETFKRKIDAIGVFKSQRAAIIFLLWSVYAKAIYWGWRRRCRYAEAYWRIR